MTSHISTRRGTIRLDAASTGTGALVATLILGLGVPAAAGARCQERLAKIDSALAQHEDLSPQLRSAITTFRDDAASRCAAGDEAGAEARLQAVEQMLPGAGGAAARERQDEAQESATRARLTPGYLAGTWCATQEQNRERGLWVFAPDGTYQVGPAEVNYALVSQGDMERFWQTFDAVSSVAPDRFVVKRHHHTTTFERGRGACQPKAPRP